jgi:plasmid stability protein
MSILVHSPSSSDIIISFMISLMFRFTGRYHMPAVTVRKLPPETHRALKLRAAQHGRSTEAEIREILNDAVRPATRLLIGSELAAFGHNIEGLDIDTSRDKTPPDPALFD